MCSFRLNMGLEITKRIHTCHSIWLFSDQDSSNSRFNQSILNQQESVSWRISLLYSWLIIKINFGNNNQRMIINRLTFSKIIQINFRYHFSINFGSFVIWISFKQIKFKGQRSFHFWGQRSYLSDSIGLFKTLARDTADQFTKLKRLQHIMRWNVSLDFEECSEFSLYKINDRVSNEDSNFYCLLNELWIQSKSVYLCIRQYSYHFLIKIIIYINILTLSGKEHTHYLYINWIFSLKRQREFSLKQSNFSGSK